MNSSSYYARIMLESCRNRSHVAPEPCSCWARSMLESCWNRDEIVTASSSCCARIRLESCRHWAYVAPELCSNYDGIALKSWSRQRASDESPVEGKWSLRMLHQVHYKCVTHVFAKALQRRSEGVTAALWRPQACVMKAVLGRDCSITTAIWGCH